MLNFSEILRKKMNYKVTIRDLRDFSAFVNDSFVKDAIKSPARFIGGLRVPDGLTNSPFDAMKCALSKSGLSSDTHTYPVSFLLLRSFLYCRAMGIAFDLRIMKKFVLALNRAGYIVLDPKLKIFSFMRPISLSRKVTYNSITKSHMKSKRDETTVGENTKD